ncbi:kinase-like domain-containing protein [Bombardia bombarda]|uniref:Kinase-like domain-containing protein n=1 Tax=Bombardia bombarda TaxID=252184 RepID=A0AA40CGA2_9PEZI|nr:kinase-like domain-containing protein [Bombardia bombarda]
MSSGPPKSESIFSPPPSLQIIQTIHRLDPDRPGPRLGHAAGHAHSSSHPAAAIAGADLVNTRNAHANSAFELLSHHHQLPSSPLVPGLTLIEPPISSSSTTPQRSASDQIQFCSHTIAPSPPLSRPDPASTNTSQPSPSGVTLRLQTDIQTSSPLPPTDSAPHGLTTTPSKRPSLNLHHRTSASSLRPITRTPSLKADRFAGAFGPASGASSTVASPIISAMGDVTPLPSPLLSSDSPGPWRRFARPMSRDATTPFSQSHNSDNESLMSPREPLPSPMAIHQSSSSSSSSSSGGGKRKPYGGLSSGSGPAAAAADHRPGGDHDGGQQQQNAQRHSHTRNRSISDYVPDPMLIPKRMATVSGTHLRVDVKNVHGAYDGHTMRREPHLSEVRGLTPVEKPPSPPPSESSVSASDSASSVSGSGCTVTTVNGGGKLRQQQQHHEYFEAYGRHDRKRRRWRAIKQLGQGTFSRVMLATSNISGYSEDEEYESTTAAATNTTRTGLETPEPTPTGHHDRRALVAVKVCEHGPRGGASEDRIEMSLKRELEIMQSIRHPSLVHLKAWNIEPTRAILVLSYCPGGDLFDIASRHKSALTAGLLRRIFAELVGAVRYLHAQMIVHRDIKLESERPRQPPPAELTSTTTDWTTYPYSVITLTDLGLSRRITEDEKLETRCGSDDYAAPEVIMGQPYDGRAIDAWSLGVLLYALLESRLPFDPLPGVTDPAMQMRMRSRTSHRIARVEWRWVAYGAGEGEEGEGEHEADMGKFERAGLRGAMEVVEGLVRRARNRWTLGKVAELEWVRGGVQQVGEEGEAGAGVKFREEEEGEEVL